MSWHQHAPEPDGRTPEERGEYLEHYEVPPDSGTASSFASRHNEFPPTAGHDAAAHDPNSGAPVHGDGTPSEALPTHWQQGDASGADPAAKEVEVGESERESLQTVDGQPREARPEDEV